MQNTENSQIIVKGRCSDRPATFFVDTGSAVSLVSKAFTDLLGITKSAKETNIRLQSFTATPIKTYGEVELSVEIARCILRHTLIITDLVDTTCLLGMDFLNRKKIGIDLRLQALVSRSGKAPFLPMIKQLQEVAAVRNTKRCVIPPNTIMFIRGSVDKVDVNYAYSGYVEPQMSLLSSHGILISSALCTTERGKIPVRVVNATDHPVTMYRNKVLGRLYPVNGKCDDLIRAVSLEKNQEEVKSVDSPMVKEEWSTDKLFKELRINEIPEISCSERHELKDLVWKYRHCFSTGPTDLGECTMYEGEINLKDGSKPVWVPARPIPYKLRGEFQQHIDDLKKAGVIEECREKSFWNSPVFLVKKPHSPNKYRFVVDMRAVNQECMPDNFQMPLIGNVVDKIGGCKVYSTFDCSQSFHQISYNERSRPITAFTACGTRYWFKRLIMGHKASGAQFSRCVTKIMANLPFEELIFFLDDLLLGSDNIQSHLQRLEHVFERLHAANMKLSPQKCHFLQKKVDFVGITIDQGGLKITDDRIKALTALKPPENKKALQKLLGFFGFNRRWIPRYASLTKCMYDQLKQGSKFEWTLDCQKNFQKLKDCIEKNITLAIPDLKDKLSSYEVTVDASQDGLGAHLTQIIDGERKLIGFYSKAVPPHKRDWGQTKLEFLSMYSAIENWKVYLNGTRFLVKTDCRSLLNIQTIFSKGNAAMRRKVQTLAEYDFRIEHLSGESNYVSDFLSRYPFKKKFQDASTQYSAPRDARSEHSDMVQRVVTICRIQEERRVAPAWKTKKVEPTSSDATVSLQKQSELLIPVDFFSPEKEFLRGPTVTTVKSVPEDIAVPDAPCYCPKEVVINATSNDPGTDTDDSPVSPSPSLTEMASLLTAVKKGQDEDDVLQNVKAWLTASKPDIVQSHRAPRDLISYWKQFQSLHLKEGIVMRKWTPVNERSGEPERDLICIPDSLQEEVLKMCHESIAVNHPGSNATLEICRRFFYWPGMTTDINLFVKSCITCGKVKQPRAFMKTKRKHLIASAFNSCIVIDHIEPEKLGLSAGGEKCILSITDVYSGYVVAAATKYQTAEETISLIMHKWVLPHGMPLEIVSDNGPGFRSQFYKSMLTAFGCRFEYGLPYECKSTAKAERTNKRLNTSLRLVLVDKNPKLWDRYLNYVCSALNSIKNRHTGFSANFLRFGSENNTPMSLLVSNSTIEEVFAAKGDTAYSQKAWELHQAYKKILRTVSNNLESSYERADAPHNRRLNKPFEKGDMCFVLVRCTKHKFSPKWFGPVPVVKVINDCVYVVKLPDGEKVVNISKLKEYARSKFSPSSLDPEAPEFKPCSKEQHPEETDEDARPHRQRKSPEMLQVDPSKKSY